MKQILCDYNLSFLLSNYYGNLFKKIITIHFVAGFLEVLAKKPLTIDFVNNCKIHRNRNSLHAGHSYSNVWKFLSRNNIERIFNKEHIKLYSIFPAFRYIPFRCHHYDINDDAKYKTNVDSDIEIINSLQ